MKFFTGITLVDITATGVIRHTAENELERNQQRNWETVLQCLGLRAQPHAIEGPICKEFLLDDYETFGEMYSGKQKCWFFTFGVESEDVFLIDGDPVSGLDKDFSQVPIITGLTETANFILPIFYPFGAIKNIVFLEHKIQLNTI